MLVDAPSIIELLLQDARISEAAGTLWRDMQEPELAEACFADARRLREEAAQADRMEVPPMGDRRF